MDKGTELLEIKYHEPTYTSDGNELKPITAWFRFGDRKFRMDSFVDPRLIEDPLIPLEETLISNANQWLKSEGALEE